MTPKWSRILVLAVPAGLALAAAGCTGTDVFSTANTPVRIEVGFQGQTDVTYDCIEIRLGNVRIKPLDGVCGPASPNPGDPCLNSADCGAGECVGSSAGEVIGSAGIQTVDGNTTVKGNLTGGPCEASIPAAVANEFVQPAPINLSEGLYQINTLNIRFAGLYIDDPPFLGACPSSTLDVAGALGDSLRFTVPPEGEKVIRIMANVDVWEDVLTTLESCLPLAAVLDTAFECTTCDAGI